jgi:hypothetical protein
MALHYYRLRLFENRVQKRNSAENVETRAIRIIENNTVRLKIFGKSKESLCGKLNAANGCCTMC